MHDLMIFMAGAGSVLAARFCMYAFSIYTLAEIFSGKISIKTMKLVSEWRHWGKNENA